jgi:hypothetical protein
MKKIERGTKKYLFILIISVSLCGIILYPLFDFLLCKFITNTQFTYSLHSHVIQPILFGFIYGITFWLIDKKRK